MSPGRYDWNCCSCCLYSCYWRRRCFCHQSQEQGQSISSFSSTSRFKWLLRLWLSYWVAKYGNDCQWLLCWVCRKIMSTQPHHWRLRKLPVCPHNIRIHRIPSLSRCSLPRYTTRLPATFTMVSDVITVSAVFLAYCFACWYNLAHVYVAYFFSLSVMLGLCVALFHQKDVFVLLCFFM